MERARTEHPPIVRRRDSMAVLRSQAKACGSAAEQRSNKSGPTGVEMRWPCTSHANTEHIVTVHDCGPHALHCLMPQVTFHRSVAVGHQSMHVGPTITSRQVGKCSPFVMSSSSALCRALHGQSA